MDSPDPLTTKSGGTTLLQLLHLRSALSMPLKSGSTSATSTSTPSMPAGILSSPALSMSGTRNLVKKCSR